jgi:hypothetical protein
LLCLFASCLVSLSPALVDSSIMIQSPPEITPIKHVASPSLSVSRSLA